MVVTSPLDRFGNTAPHHAAAMGNSEAVLQMFAYEGHCTLQNTCAETYLHVYRVQGVQDLHHYVHIFQDDGGFPFEDQRSSRKTRWAKIC